MKNILHGRSKRHGIDGWALKHKDGISAWRHTVCTTRREARELKAQQLPDMRDQIEVVKVRIHLEVTGRDSGEYQIGIGRTGSGASPQSDSSSFQARSEVDTIGQNSR